MSQPNHVDNRRTIIRRLRQEIVGPQPLGDPVDLSDLPRFERFFDAKRAVHQADTGEEILTRDRPTKRYGSGVLFPPETEGEDGGDGTVPQDRTLRDDDEEFPSGDDESIDDPPSRSTAGIEEMRKRARRTGVDDPQHDLDLTAANQFRPSVMAVSFMCEMRSGGIAPCPCPWRPL